MKCKQTADFFRKRPKGAPGGVDAKAFTISGKDARQDSIGYNGRPKDGGLKTKSIAAALERVCINFNNDKKYIYSTYVLC